jgi:hypothetical protein
VKTDQLRGKNHGFIFASRAGNLHSYNSNSFWASSSLVWSEIRPHTTQNHTCVCGFHLIVLCSTGPTLPEMVGENIATKVVKDQQYCSPMIEVIGKESVSDDLNAHP